MKLFTALAVGVFFPCQRSQDKHYVDSDENGGPTLMEAGARADSAAASTCLGKKLQGWALLDFVVG